MSAKMMSEKHIGPLAGAKRHLSAELEKFRTNRSNKGCERLTIKTSPFGVFERHPVYTTGLLAHSECTLLECI